METYDAIRKRASVREYQTKSVERAILEKLVDAGRRAPTAMGVEPWEFVVVTKPETVKGLGKAVTPCDFVQTAAACIAVYCKETKYFLEDGCAATQNILLAAADIGLGACWIAGEREPWAKGINRTLKAPKDYHLVSMVALGWPAKETEQVKNRSLENVIRWESW
ncbi:MAG: nitroreductase family protein [Candidatus Omnitrophica bacterium]|nr:nitroreductase family protein [Candidatus Omnitrophota bacterium]